MKSNPKNRSMLIVLFGVLIASIYYLYPHLMKILEPKKELVTKVVEVAQPDSMPVPELIREVSNLAIDSDKGMSELIAMKKKIDLQADIIKTARDADIPIESLNFEFLQSKKEITQKAYPIAAPIIIQPELPSVQANDFDDIPQSEEPKVLTIQESPFFMGLRFEYQIEVDGVNSIVLSSQGEYWDTSIDKTFFDVNLLSIDKQSICVKSLITNNSKCLEL
ncbi:hypothetical protein [Aliivibrio fischeri]|uniref:hypothetical protein n=1 Tax=Aliivibrio fischeri TaxID=668 RepID=UPI0007C4A878|nr:hypothetical protein [Aliivibrio fischeri]